jgi:pyruvate/2-oxoglutarate dehydrogenase complex dihydrolipoamide acyltransferase (E2) component
MTYSFTFDHRVIDGAPATMFIIRLTEVLENPGLLLL